MTLVALAVVLVALGAALLVAPEWADAAWPWPLTPLTARAVGAWCVGLGVAAGHARLVDDAPSLGPIGVTGVLFGVLQTHRAGPSRVRARLVEPAGGATSWSSPRSPAVGAWLLVRPAAASGVGSAGDPPRRPAADPAATARRRVLRADPDLPSVSGPVRAVCPPNPRGPAPCVLR